MSLLKSSGSTIAYQLRHQKAIERNLFIDLLRRIHSSDFIDISSYRYVGFGAAFLEDFKLMHMELDISHMDCIEMDAAAASRQRFNNPYKFIETFEYSSTDYIKDHYKDDKSQIIWLDFAMPRELMQQLLDVRVLTTRIQPFDILKVTFNSNIGAFINTHKVYRPNTRSLCHPSETKSILAYLKEHDTYSRYLPPNTKAKDLENFAAVIKAMALNAMKFGLKEVRSNLEFNQISTFVYADGQEMLTITGIFCDRTDLPLLLEKTELESWKFYNPIDPLNEFSPPREIHVPPMTVLERMAIDSQMPMENCEELANLLQFKYSDDIETNIEVLNHYQTYYKYLPYFSKVTF